jgi:hypothetical protein
MIRMTRRQRIEWALRGKPKTKAEAMRNIRRHFAEMGMPLDHLTDEQIEERVHRLGEAARKMLIRPALEYKHSRSDGARVLSGGLGDRCSPTPPAVPAARKNPAPPTEADTGLRVLLRL